MERYHFFAFLLCGVFVSRGLSLPFRNFSIDCETMVTDHEVKPQESPSPYRISLPSERYDPGREVKVNIEGPSDGAGFKWFMLQARDIDENIPAGSFLITDANTQTFDCYNLSNSALIHIDSNEKHNVTSLWVSPEARRIQFIASVFQDPETYWVAIANIVLFPRDNNQTASNSTIVEESKQANVSSSRSRKKSSGITVKINCGQGGSYASSSECAKSSTSSQSGGSQPQGGVVYQGGIRKNGCIGGAIASVYNKYGCSDPGVDYGGSNSYGQSVSTVSNKGKVVVYPPSNPFPPERTSYTSQLANSKYKHIQSTKYTEKIQGSRPESDVRITIQSGQPLQICDKTSSSYNSQACKLSIQSSTSQSSSSYGSQSGTKVTVGNSGSSPSGGGSGTKIIFGGSGSPASVGTSGTSTSSGGKGVTITVGSSGSSTYSGGSGCRQGYRYEGNSCKPSGSSSQQSYGSNQGGQSGSYGSSSQYGQSGSYGGGGQYGQSGSYGGSSQYGQSGSYGGSSQYGQGGSYGGSSQYGQSGQSGSYSGGRPYGQGGQSGSYGGGSQYGQGGSYGSSSNYGQGSQYNGGYSSNRCDEGDASTYGAKALSSSNCRGKRDVAAQDTFNAFIEKIREKKASPHPLIRRIRSEKVRTPIRAARNEKVSAA